MKNCSAIIISRHRYTATFFPILCPSAVAMISRSLCFRCQIHQVNKRDNKQPYQTHELPEQVYYFDIVGVVAAPTVADGHDDQSNCAHRNVQQAEPGEGVEPSPEGWRSPRILKQRDALV